MFSLEADFTEAITNENKPLSSDVDSFYALPLWFFDENKKFCNLCGVWRARLLALKKLFMDGWYSHEDLLIDRVLTLDKSDIVNTLRNSNVDPDREF